MSTVEAAPLSYPENLEGSSVVLSADSPEGKHLIEQIQKAPDPVEDAQPDYDLSQKPDEEIRHVLGKRFFINTDRLKQGAPNVILQSADSEHAIEVPTRLLVDAASFVNWNGRASGVNKTISTDEGYQTLPSFEVLKRYAAMGSSSPPLKEVSMFLQPDGKIFFGGSSDGAHRTGAAILKGRSSIETYSILLWSLPENVL